MSAQSHAFGEASTMGEAPIPITAMPSIALGTFIFASMAASLGGRLARSGAVSMSYAGPSASPTATKVAQTTRALVESAARSGLRSKRPSG